MSDLERNIAVVFPGQGSQSVGMLQQIAFGCSIINETFAEASSVLGYDLWQLVQAGPEEQLNQTEFTQPALLASDVAVWRIVQSNLESVPKFLAGHSLGEYAALVCAEAIEFVDAVKLVSARGRLMQEAVPAGQGAMLAVIGLDNEQIKNLCAEITGIIAPANFNSIGQTVLAGEKVAAEQAVILAKKMGARVVKMLPVSVPAHCKLMEKAASHLARLLTEVTIIEPKIPVINNVDVACYKQPDEIKDALVRQLYSPVRWVETVQLLEQKGVELLVECGPGNVLAGLNKRINRNLLTVSFEEILST